VHCRTQGLHDLAGLVNYAAWAKVEEPQPASPGGRHAQLSRGPTALRHKRAKPGSCNDFLPHWWWIPISFLTVLIRNC